MGTFGTYTGDMNIPDEKKELFRQQMSRLLNLGGMMQFEAVSLYGYEMELLKPVEILSGKNVMFHYNYFEDRPWETAGFNVDTCHLWSEKIGSSEFDDVMMAAYMLYEAYDENAGLTDLNGSIINSTAYMGWINNILGTAFSMKNRFRLWENAERYALARIDRGYSELFSENHVKAIIPKGLQYAVGGTDYADLMYIIHGTSSLMTDESEIKENTYPADVRTCKKYVEAYFANTKENQAEKLWDFLKKDYASREKEGDDQLKGIAEMSLIMPARVFVYLAAEMNENLEFWDIWKEYKDSVYRDEHMKKYASDELTKWRKEEQEKPIPPVPTSKFLRQDGYFTFYDTPAELKDKPNYYISDDDRLYWWDGTDEVRISDKTDEWLKGLAKQHKELMDSENYTAASQDFLQYFLSSIVEIDSYYKRIFPFQTMFYEFLQNSTKKEYVAAVELLKILADSEEYRKAGEVIKYVKACGWDITSKNVTHNSARIGLKRYLSVMANKQLRKNYFGF